jgi:hypothetical protein
MPNNFQIIEDGDYVICAISKKIIPLENLNYWSVEKQEAYFLMLSHQLKEKKRIINFSIDHVSKSIDQHFLKSFFQEFD